GPPHSRGVQRRPFALPFASRWYSSRHHELRHSQKVVGAGDEVGPESCPLRSAVSSTPQASDHLHPAEDLLHALPTSLADLVAAMPSRAPIDARAASAGDVLRDVRSDPEIACSSDKLLGVIALVRPESCGPEAAPPQA